MIKVFELTSKFFLILANYYETKNDQIVNADAVNL